jgi:phosphoribosylformylglycinamidine (FGAM) synthase-like amidotransferase family enzyme
MFWALQKDGPGNDGLLIQLTFPSCSAILFNKRLSEMFRAFRNRRDTFSLGVCNGCQLMALLGWVGSTKDSVERGIL